MSTQTSTDRRRRRRRETIDEVVETALQVMAEAGAAGLSLGEVARRMGLRTPSLYGYFPSKAALYDEVFARGWRSFAEALQEYDGPLPPGTTLHDRLVAALRTSLDWASTNPAYSQLMFWRPVPQWQPSPDSYVPALEVRELTARAFGRLLADGHLRPDTDLDEAVDVWTVVVSGLISQRLSNEPALPVTDGRMPAIVEPLASTFTAHYGSHDGSHDGSRSGSRSHR
jgi:AcrR family transcriptional regulator